MSKIIRIFLNFFPMKNINLDACFFLLKFFENFNFQSTSFTKIMPIFQLLDSEQMLFFHLFIIQLCSHLMRKLLKKS